jgi:hypothetical protein
MGGGHTMGFLNNLVSIRGSTRTVMYRIDCRCLEGKGRIVIFEESIQIRIT